MTAKKTIYIIRHGETEYNKQGIIQGSGIDSDLNETGRKQADQFYQAYHHIGFDAIYTSELKRTQQSVAAFTKRDIPIRILPELNEINWGVFEGLKGTPDSHKIYLAMTDDWKAGLLDRSVEDGETPNELQRRQARGLEKIMANQSENQVLIAMHGRAMRSFLCLMTGTPLSQMDEFKHNNLCLYKLEYHDGRYAVLEHNCSKHLWI